MKLNYFLFIQLIYWKRRKNEQNNDLHRVNDLLVPNAIANEIAYDHDSVLRLEWKTWSVRKYS